MQRIFKVFLIFSIISVNSFAQERLDFKKVPLPLQMSGEPVPIAELQDETLQKVLEDEINSHPVWKGLVSKRLMSISIMDLSNFDDIKYAGINDEHMMYAASLPKIAVLLASMDAIDKGELLDSKEIRKDMRLMISKSNNQASTRMIDRVGYEKIESVLRSRNKLYDEKVGGGLWVGKRYAAGGRRYPEPLKGLSHAATTKQVCSFYYHLALGNLVNRKRSKEMLEIMKNPELHHKFVNTLDTVAPLADVYRKSGSWKNYHSDSALVWGPRRKYIIVALLDDAFGEQIIRSLVVPMEKVMEKSRQISEQKLREIDFD